MLHVGSLALAAVQDDVSAEGGTQQLGEPLGKKNQMNVEFGQSLPQRYLKKVGEAPEPQLLHFKGLRENTAARLLKRLGFVLDLHRDFEQHVAEARKLI